MRASVRYGTIPKTGISHTWYQKKLIEDVPEEELHAALIDEDCNQRASQWTTAPLRAQLVGSSAQFADF